MVLVAIEKSWAEGILGQVWLLLLVFVLSSHCARTEALAASIAAVIEISEVSQGGAVVPSTSKCSQWRCLCLSQLPGIDGKAPACSISSYFL